MCSLRWHMDSRECVEAIVEHLVWLLYPKFVLYSFVLAAARVLLARIRGQRMTLQAANVLLSYTWLVVTVFGPCLPILNALIAAFVNIYCLLFFGLDLGLLDTKQSA
eukprot:2808557-Amphidinium_carterae.1